MDSWVGLYIYAVSQLLSCEVVELLGCDVVKFLLCVVVYLCSYAYIYVFVDLLSC